MEMECGEQLDLFEGPRLAPPVASKPAAEPPLAATALGDAELIDALPQARLRDSLAIVREIARRHLAFGIPALAKYCRLHAGFNWGRVNAEQMEAVKALGIIGGREASAALAQLIVGNVFEGPGLKLALQEAVRLGSSLPEPKVVNFLSSDDPGIRATAARCVGIWPMCVPLLIELLQDLHDDVRLAAGCALGRIGNGTAREVLLKALCEQPSPEIVEAIVGIPDEEVFVLLGRTADTQPELAGLIRDALESIDHPLAARIAKRIRSQQELPANPAVEIT